MRTTLITFGTALLVLLNAATGAEYVVSMHHAEADDSGPGTAERPWRTLGRAAAEAKAGDTVRVYDGTYREQVQFENSGTGPDAMIRVEAAPGEDITITALDLVTDWETAGEDTYRKTGWETDTQMVLIDRKVPLRQIGPCMFAEKGWVMQVGEDEGDLFPGSFYCDKEEKALYIYMPVDRPPRWHDIEASVRDYCLWVGEWTHVRGIRCVGSNWTQRTTWPPLACKSNSIVEDCEVLWADFCGFAVNADNVTVRGCRFNYCGGVGISMQGSGHLLEDNVTSHNNWRQVKLGWHTGGIKNCACTNVTVRRHIAAHTWGPGIWFDIDCRDITIEDSFCYGNAVGIHYEISYPAIIRNNVCVGNKRNIWSSNGTGVRIESNTCVGGLEGITLSGHDRGKDYRLKDNVVTRNICAGQTMSALMISPDSDFCSNNRSDENLLWGVGGPPVFQLPWEIEIPTIQAWREQTGHDGNSAVADPQFADRRKLNLSPAEQFRKYGAPEEVLRWVHEEAWELARR